MADRKPLSDKKLRRMLKKQKMKEEKKNPDKSSSTKLPKEWEAPPKNLKGKEKGLWYRDRQKLLNQMENKGPLMNIEIKLTKKEKRALREQKAEKSESSESSSQCFRIAFDPTREQMIEEYLNSVADKPPSFLIPQHEYHKKLKRRYPVDRNHKVQGSCEISEEDSSPRVFDIEENLQNCKRLCESFAEETLDRNSALSNINIQAFLNGHKTENIESTDGQSRYTNEGFADGSDTSYGMNENGNVFDSLDKYKHLEETPFKQSFLKILSSSIQSNLQKALKHDAMPRNKSLDRDLYFAFRAKEKLAKYQHMLKARTRLPAFKMRLDILRIISHNQIVLLSGETGCGKTTQVAQFILDEAIENYNGSMCNILCTQPRRISAVSVAQRVADERAEVLGRESIGFQIRLEKKIGRQRGAILYCTTGILLQYMQSDPALKKYSHIILDEIHERDTLCDFVLTILKDVAAKRSDLKIVLMSATLNAEQFSRYFHDCPSLNIPGYTYPVEELYLEDVLALTHFQFGNVKKKQSDNEADLESFKSFVLPYVRTLKTKYPDFVLQGLNNPNSEKINADLIVELIKYISCNLGPGAILVFVPGWEDINSIVRKINENDKVFVPSKFLIIPLHSMLPTANQQSVFERPPAGQRKIVVATNIAETSITIDDVVYVIDCGRIKIKNYDVVNNISTLKPEFVSLANARQRRGRAGRVQNGVCYHLFSRGREKALDEYPLPEMLRTRLEEMILNIKLLQLGNAAQFLEHVMDPPNPKTVSSALKLLRQLNALDENENLTPLGFHLAKLPLDPHIGKMLLIGVTMSCLNPILSIAATLSFKDPFYLPLGEERQLKERKLELDNGHKSDHLIMAEVIDRWEKLEKRGDGKHFCARNYLTRGTLYQLRDQKHQFAQYLCEMGFLSDTNYRHPSLNMNSSNIAMVKAVICSGLCPNVAIIKRKISTNGKNILLLKTSEDGKVTLHPKSVNTLQQSEFESNFLVYHEKLRSSCVFIYDSTMVSALPLLVFCHDFYLTYEKKKVLIQLNKDLQFVCNKKTAHLIVELKLRLSWLLEYKLSHPGQVTWNDKSSDILLLKTLTNLFTSENDVLMGAKCDSSD